MSTDKDTRKVILLVVFGVILAIAAFILAYWLLFGETETKGPVQEGASFPESPMDTTPTPSNENDEYSQVPTDFPTDTATDTPVEAEIIQEYNSDWTDEIVQHTSRAPLPGQTDTPQSVSNSPEVFDTDQFYYEPYVPTTKPGPPVLIPLSYSSFATLDNVMPPSPALAVSSFKNCGSISVPATETSLNRLISKLDNDSSAICLGKAIANNCDGARIRLSGSVSGYIYVAERNDGICGMGSAFDGSNIVNLCSVEKMMNEATNQNLTFDEWQDEFDDDPGQTFVDAFRASVVDPTATVNWSPSDCQMFEI